ncbi:Nitric-oxide reductase, quinol-dependent [Saccharolobus shibatae B12]|uniref:Nitric-oxide reductase, quinol-dependent n=1 Tax=Saccharolobus shibatae (strain ATCC 51178 / DSM 5389 / JCM 8931 / NBRC 15437 / B12) TaxID=523848 RepID=A0A8F5BNU8_SACSH|nr:nitric-oxide reductase large subunit [Saccharolobus shibatae]QXJ28614.1 Nitric-oxide reductase, quinol-dependent [Saccharolobus shibatae B12]
MAKRIRGDVWSNLVLVATVLVYVVYIALAGYTLTHLPPIPSVVETENGTVLFTGGEVISGKVLMQKYGLFDYGSFWGFGGYYGTDFTALALKVINQTADPPTIKVDGQAYSSITDSETSKWVVSNDYVKAYNTLYNELYNILYNNSSNYGLKPNLVNPNDLRNITAFILWGAMVSLLGYTNGFPYMPQQTQPSVNVSLSTWIMVIVLLAVLVSMVSYVSLKILDHWRDPRISVPLPPPSASQRIGLIGVFFASVLAGIQGLLGYLAMHYYVDPEGILGLINFLPFNVTRALHLNMAVVWIALTWITFSIFALPYLGVPLSRKLSFAILGLTLFAGVGLLLGILFSYNQLIPSPYWFIFGAQGKPNDVDQGTFWLLLVALIFFLASSLFFKASKSTAEPLRPLTRITAIGLLGSGIGAIFGSLPIIAPWPNFTEDQFFLWIMIHSFVEGFWPSIVIPVVLILLVVNNLVPPSLATMAASIDSVSEILSGMIGTAHHYYFGGEPLFWMYLGASAAILEVIPILFLTYYAILLWRRGEAKTEFQKTLVTTTLISAIGGGFVGGIIGGASILNAPMINYYVHGLQFTMAHAHLAFPLVWGLTAILMWIAALYLSNGIKENELKTLRIMILIYAIGFILQGIDLWALGAVQLATVLRVGYWAAKGTLFYLLSIPDLIVWLRMIGDVVAGFAAAVIIIYTLKGVIKSYKIKI